MIWTWIPHPQENRVCCGTLLSSLLLVCAPEPLKQDSASSFVVFGLFMWVRRRMGSGWFWTKRLVVGGSLSGYIIIIISSWPNLRSLSCGFLLCLPVSVWIPHSWACHTPTLIIWATFFLPSWNDQQLSVWKVLYLKEEWAFTEEMKVAIPFSAVLRWEKLLCLAQNKATLFFLVLLDFLTCPG